MSTFFATMAVLLFVSILTGTSVYLYSKRNRTTISPTQELSIQMVHATILSEIKNIRELSTIENNFKSTVVFNEAEKKLWGHDVPGTTRKFKLNYSGTIVCGCDLNKIIIDNNFFNQNHLRITVPESKILHIYPHIDSIEPYDVSTGIFASDITLEEQNNAVAKDLEVVKEQQIKDGILLKSNENIRGLLLGITAPIGVEAEINFIESRDDSDTPLLEAP